MVQPARFPGQKLGEPQGALQIPPLRYPGFPVDLGGVGELHAPFLRRNKLSI
jgi:hypothetical protein